MFFPVFSNVILILMSNLVIHSVYFPLVIHNLVFWYSNFQCLRIALIALVLVVTTVVVVITLVVVIITTTTTINVETTEVTEIPLVLLEEKEEITEHNHMLEMKTTETTT